MSGFPVRGRNSMLDRQLTDRRIVESILRSEKLEVEFEPALSSEGASVLTKFTIYSLDITDGRAYIFGEANSTDIWTAVRAKLEERDL